MATRITSKGQITLPKRIRDDLGLEPGDEIDFVTDRGDVKIRKVLIESPFARYQGYLKDLAGQNPDQLVADLRGD